MVRARDPDDLDPFRHRRSKHWRLPKWLVPAIILLLVGGGLLTYFLQGPSIGTRNFDRKILAVVLPPPPPPPPKEKPPEPPKQMQEAKAEPTPTPPTPEPQANDALSAREGPGTNSFGLAAGNGGGTRIGGGVGGDPFMAYAMIIQSDIRRALQVDPKLRSIAYSMKIEVKVSPDGAIQDVSFDEASRTDPERDAAIKRVLASLILSRKPPEGLPRIKLQLASRSSF